MLKVYENERVIVEVEDDPDGGPVGEICITQKGKQENHLWVDSKAGKMVITGDGGDILNVSTEVGDSDEPPTIMIKFQRH